MIDLEETTWWIVDEGRDARHGASAVYAALCHVQRTGSVNGAWELLNQFRVRTVPRWLVDRWAHDGGLVDERAYRHGG